MIGEKAADMIRCGSAVATKAARTKIGSRNRIEGEPGASKE